MQKTYCPIRIKNPNAKDSLVRLLDKQKIHIIFDEKYNDYKVDLTGQYLTVDEVKEVQDGWMVTISQIDDRITYRDSALFLGGINFYDEENEKKSSLCVMTNHQNNDFVRIIDPKNCTCTISPNQVIDVIIHSDPSDSWCAYPSGKDICVEMIQHCLRGSKNICPETCENKNIIEHFFRFRYDQHSVEYLSKVPYAKHDGGHILFVNSKEEKTMLNLTCVWRGKNSIYKALLLPRIPILTNANNHFMKKQKKCMKSNVILHKMESKSLEDGCNVLLARNL